MGEEKKVNPLVLHRDYITYQSLFQVKPYGVSMSDEDIFKKTVLYVISWIRIRIMTNLPEELWDASHGTSAIKAARKYLEDVLSSEKFPEPNQYREFDLNQLNEVKEIAYIELKMHYSEELHTWALRLIEQDSGAVGTKVRNRSFKTNISVCGLEDGVAIGTRIVCHDALNAQEDAASLRPVYLESLWGDEELELVEYGTDFKMLPTEKAADTLSTCKFELMKSTAPKLEKNLQNPLRHLPVLIIPDFNKINVPLTDLEKQLLKFEIQNFVMDNFGYLQVIVLEGHPRHLENTILAEYKDRLLNGDILLYRATHVNSAKPFVYEFNPKAIQISQSRNDADDDEDEDEDEEPYAYPQEQIEKEVRAEGLRKRNNFSGVHFYSELVRDTVGGKTADPDSDEIDEHLDYQEMVDKNNELQHDLENARTEIKNLKAKHEKDILEMSRIQQATLKEKEKTERQRDKAENSKQEREDALKASKEKILEAKTVRKMARPLFDVDFNGGAKAFENWFDNCEYSSRLILDKSARRSLKDAEKTMSHNQWLLLYHAIFYLYGVAIETEKYRGRRAPEADDLAKYDVMEIGFEDAPSYSSGTFNSKKDAYERDFSEHNPKLKKTYVDRHIKCGVNEEYFVRVYYHYDLETKKAIIGHINDHLPVHKHESH